MVKMFWGITLENGKRYSQTVDVGFHVSMAALEGGSDGNCAENEKKAVSVMLEHEKTEFLLCTLQYDGCRQQTLDLNFIEGEEVTFFINGPGTVHLTGYVIELSDESSSDEMTDEVSQSGKRKLKEDGGKKPKRGKYEESLEMLEPRSDPETDTDEIMETMKNDVNKTGKFKSCPSPQKKDKKNKTKDKCESPEATTSAQMSARTQRGGGENGEDTQSLSAKRKKKKKDKKIQQQLQLEAQAVLKGVDLESYQPTMPQPGLNAGGRHAKYTTPCTTVRRLQGGVLVEDLGIGNGPIAKKGKTVQITYVGKLSNNKVFDSNKKDPLKFRVGAGEVIKGMEIGIEGMKVGGKRRITVPPSQGYGKEGKDCIPPNSTLIFDVELKAVN